ncbi:MAG: DUF488 domain-containing protein [Phycisphaerae bacterium]
MISVRRVYEPPSPIDGFRVLVDRLWPRGLTKDQAKFDLWLKDIAPSDELRKWYGHDPDKWGEFRLKYLRELKGRKDAVEQLRQVIRQHQVVTLLYAASDERHNNAVVLAELFGRLTRKKPASVAHKRHAAART